MTGGAWQARHPELSIFWNREGSQRVGRHAPLEGPSTRGARARHAHRSALRDASRENKVAAVRVQRGPGFAFDVVSVVFE